MAFIAMTASMMIIVLIHITVSVATATIRTVMVLVDIGVVIITFRRSVVERCHHDTTRGHMCRNFSSSSFSLLLLMVRSMIWCILRTILRNDRYCIT